jgi:ATP-dependent DNA ligase
METLPIEEFWPIGTWQFEPKWHGFRCIAFDADDSVELHPSLENL